MDGVAGAHGTLPMTVSVGKIDGVTTERTDLGTKLGVIVGATTKGTDGPGETMIPGTGTKVNTNRWMKKMPRKHPKSLPPRCLVREMPW